MLEVHPLSAVRDCLFSIFAATLHIGGRSYIRNLRTRHAVVTGTHLSRNNKTLSNLYGKTFKSKIFIIPLTFTNFGYVGRVAQSV